MGGGEADRWKGVNEEEGEEEREEENSFGNEQKQEENKFPPWLQPLLKTSFYGQCRVHADCRRSTECNMYCLDCMNGSLCSICLADSHADQRSIQIRRSSYQDVIRVSEIYEFLDINGVETFMINSAKIVFLHQRPPQSRPTKGTNNACKVCERSLYHSSSFCSLSCKIIGISKEALKNTAAKTHDEQPTNNTMQCKIAKRRKGVPYRAPMGAGSII